MIAPLPRKNCASQNIMKTSTGSPFNSTSLLKSPVVSVPSNGATNHLKKKVEGRKRLKSSQIFANLEFDYLTPQRVKQSYRRWG